MESLFNAYFVKFFVFFVNTAYLRQPFQERILCFYRYIPPQVFHKNIPGEQEGLKKRKLIPVPTYASARTPAEQQASIWSRIRE